MSTTHHTQHAVPHPDEFSRSGRAKSTKFLLVVSAILAINVFVLPVWRNGAIVVASLAVFFVTAAKTWYDSHRDTGVFNHLHEEDSVEYLKSRAL